MHIKRLLMQECLLNRILIITDNRKAGTIIVSLKRKDRSCFLDYVSCMAFIRHRLVTAVPE